MEISTLITVAILVEAIWENCKIIWQHDKLNINMLGSLILSIIVCLLTQVDIFAVLGINLIVPFAGSILTGIIVSRGANFVNDLFTKLKGGK